MYQRALGTGAVGVVTHAHYHRFGVCTQTGEVLLGRGAKLQHQKLHLAVYHAHKWHRIGGEYGVAAGCAARLHVGVDVKVGYVALGRVYLVGYGGSHIDIVGPRVALGYGPLLAHYHHGHLVAAYVAHGLCLAPCGVQPVKPFVLLAGYKLVTLATGEVVYQPAGHGNFGLGLFRERYTYCVADTVS